MNGIPVRALESPKRETVRERDRESDEKVYVPQRRF